MHTIVILSDTLTQDAPAVKNLKKLFPDCNIQIFSKTAKESHTDNISIRKKNNLFKTKIKHAQNRATT